MKTTAITPTIARLDLYRNAETALVILLTRIPNRDESGQVTDEAKAVARSLTIIQTLIRNAS